MRQEKKAPPRIPGRNKGLLVVLEGIDGTGKSTQARALLRRLGVAGIPAARFREPSRGHWGREIKRLARTAGSVTPERELELFVKDRRENVERNLEPALRAGKVVVLDRYYFSTVAYQGAKGLDPVRIRRLNERFAPRPDLVFIFDLDPKAGLARIAGRGCRDELFEREDYLARVREIFLGFKGKRFVPLDAGRDKRSLARDIWERVRRLALPRPI